MLRKLLALILAIPLALAGMIPASATYELGKSDKGKYVRAQITTTNLLGSTVIVTKSTGKFS